MGIGLFSKGLIKVGVRDLYKVMWGFMTIKSKVQFSKYQLAQTSRTSSYCFYKFSIIVALTIPTVYSYLKDK